MDIERKIERLKEILKSYKKICVAYSGGTDSDFLLNVAFEALGNNVIAVIAKGSNMAEKDIKDAVRLGNNCGAKVFVENVDVFAVEEFRNNSRQRCYFCKKNRMSAVFERAEKEGFKLIADGKNADDAKSFRPGAKAAAELGIVSPLYEAGFTKAEIRQAAKNMGLETWNKASNSCLVTRFPYDTLITEEKLLMVEKGEKLISNLGIPSVRIRVHGDIARIEMPPEYFSIFISKGDIIHKLKEIGFRYITLDLEGFRSGSMD